MSLLDAKTLARLVALAGEMGLPVETINQAGERESSSFSGRWIATLESEGARK